MMKKTIIRISLFCVAASLIIQHIHAAKDTYTLQSHTDIPQSTSSYFTTSNALIFGILITGGYIAFQTYYDLAQETKNVKNDLEKIKTDTTTLLSDTAHLKRKANEAERLLSEVLDNQGKTNSQLDKIDKKIDKVQEAIDLSIIDLHSKIDTKHEESQSNLEQNVEKINRGMADFNRTISASIKDYYSQTKENANGLTKLFNEKFRIAHADLASNLSRLENLEGKVDNLEGKVDNLTSLMNSVHAVGGELVEDTAATKAAQKELRQEAVALGKKMDENHKEIMAALQHNQSAQHNQPAQLKNLAILVLSRSRIEEGRN